MDGAKILLGPLVTEKTVRSEQMRIYCFWVHADATKIDVKNAVWQYYGRKVRSVQLSSLPKKERAMGKGKVMVRRAKKRKAYVRLLEDSPFEVVSVKGVEKKKVESKKEADKKKPPVKKKEKQSS
jgi:large subunit ribosomal protein L23